MSFIRRYIVHLTHAEREAVLEALGSRLAGEMGATEGVAQRRETYETAETKIAGAPLTRLSPVLDAPTTPKEPRA